MVVSQSITDKHLEARIGTPKQYQVVYSGVDVERIRALRHGPETVRANFGVPADLGWCTYIRAAVVAAGGQDRLVLWDVITAAKYMVI